MCINICKYKKIYLYKNENLIGVGSSSLLNLNSIQSIVLLSVLMSYSVLALE